MPSAQTGPRDIVVGATIMSSGTLIRDIRASAVVLSGSSADFDPILADMGGVRFALIGEASHGTHDFYRIRIELTKRLIREHGFCAVAVEADWPDAYRVNDWVRGRGADTGANEALSGFQRFPQWMWRNAVVLDFVGWLRAHNESLSREAQRVGFYGLDLYSLHASMDAVLGYLENVDPEAAQRARERYSCFDHFGDEPQRYGMLAGLGMASGCEGAVVAQLEEMLRHASELKRPDGFAAEDDLFAAQQNAALVKDAEAYYRSMYRGGVESWNLRDTHMANTLDALAEHLARTGASGKIVVWAHNSHLGDARATDLGDMGELNLGQLTRERHGKETRLVGFTTHTGTVTASNDWGEPVERKHVRPSMPNSVESLFHKTDLGRFLLRPAEIKGLEERRLERAIGVIYRPRTERASHYFHVSLSEQFDWVMHLDETRALEPLERTGLWERGELPETYPTAL